MLPKSVAILAQVYVVTPSFVVFSMEHRIRKLENDEEGRGLEASSIGDLGGNSFSRCGRSCAKWRPGEVPSRAGDRVRRIWRQATVGDTDIVSTLLESVRLRAAQGSQESGEEGGPDHEYCALFSALFLPCQRGYGAAPGA